MEKAYEKFYNYRRCSEDELDGDRQTMYERYQAARNAISHSSLKCKNDKCYKLIGEWDATKTWERIDWKGNFQEQVTDTPLIDELTEHFEVLYS